jgi:hypothetical protein
MTFAGKIIGNECLTRRALPFLIIGSFDFDTAGEHEYDLAGRCMMPALIEAGRQLNEAHPRRRPGVGLFKYSTRGTRPRLNYRHFDFLESGTTVFGGVKPY